MKAICTYPSKKKIAEKLKKKLLSYKGYFDYIKSPDSSSDCTRVRGEVISHSFTPRECLQATYQHVFKKWKDTRRTRTKPTWI